MSLTGAILRALANGPKTNFELAEATGESGGAVARTCNGLLSQGKIVRIDGGSGRGTRALYALPQDSGAMRRLDGAALYDRIVAHAFARKLPPNDLIRPLTGGKHAGTWLSELRRSARPRPYTVERIEALLAGKVVPDSPHAVKRRAALASRSANDPSFVHVAGRKERIENPPPPVDRDPCFKCGVRADVGCRHRQAAWG